MLARRLNRWLEKYNIHYGWIMAILAFLTTVFSSATLSTPQILIIPMVEAFGWDISDITSAIALMYVILASMCPFGAALMLGLGVTKVVIISILFTFVGLLSTILALQSWHLFFSLGICLGIASGIMGLGLTATVATRWFSAKRGLVVGILTSAFAAGQLTFVPFMAWLTTTYDWRMAVAPVLVGSCLCGILFLLLGKNWPSDLDIPPYGDKSVFHPPKSQNTNAIIISLVNLRSAINHPGFWMLATTFFICGLTSTGIVGQHFIPLCADNGVGIVAAASYLAIMGIFNFMGTMGSGWLTDRYDNYLLLAAYYGLRGLSLIYLPYSNFDIYSLTLWAIFFGLDFIATVPPTVALTGKFFGSTNGPIVFGWVFSAHQFGSAFAAYGAGISRDSLLSYLPAFVAAGVISLIASLIVVYYRARPSTAYG